MPLPRLPRLLALILYALGSLAFSPYSNLWEVSILLPTTAKHEETFLEELQTRQNFVLGQKTAPNPHSSAFTP